MDLETWMQTRLFLLKHVSCCGTHVSQILPALCFFAVSDEGLERKKMRGKWTTASQFKCLEYGSQVNFYSVDHWYGIPPK